MNDELFLQDIPKRVVSCVPSMTESMFDLGLGKYIVAVTDYCVYPKESVALLPKIGGPKTLDIEKVFDLKPDLVLCNREENSKADIETLVSAGLSVWVTFPLTVSDAINDLRMLASAYHSAYAMQVIKTLEDQFEWLSFSLAGRNGFRYFCPIWQRENEDGASEWMTYNRRTYMHDLLLNMGGENVFGEVNPAEEDARYFYVKFEDILERQPDILILPDEPFAFGDKEKRMFDQYFNSAALPKRVKIILVDGSLITWHGTRLARCIQVLPDMLPK